MAQNNNKMPLLQFFICLVIVLKGDAYMFVHTYSGEHCRRKEYCLHYAPFVLQSYVCVFCYLWWYTTGRCFCEYLYDITKDLIDG